MVALDNITSTDLPTVVKTTKIPLAITGSMTTAVYNITSTISSTVVKSTMSPLSNSNMTMSNSTLAPDDQVHINMTANPFNNDSSWNYGDYDFNSTTYLFPPYYVVNTASTDYFAYSYYSFLILLLLISLAAVFTKLAIRRRQQLANELARRRARQNNVSTVSGTQMEIVEPVNDINLRKNSDMPPAYDDVMQGYLNAKQQLENSEDSEGATGGLSASTITISTTATETVIEVPSSSSIVVSSAAGEETAITTISPPAYNDSLRNGEHAA